MLLMQNLPQQYEVQ